MKILMPVDASSAALAPIKHLVSLHRMSPIEVLVLNVQPRFHRHVSQFSSRGARDELRAERSREAMARAIEELSLAGVPFRAVAEAGLPAERIAAVATGISAYFRYQSGVIPSSPSTKVCRSFSKSIIPPHL